YREYLRIIAGFWPTAFVMENVRGLLSAKLSGESVFERICGDLRDPAAALGRKSPHTYTLHALAPERLFPGNIAGDFLIRCERHGFPQARHRVIIVGLRNDTDPSRLGRLDAVPSVTVREAIGDLPILRSGLSKEADSSEAWLDAVLEICSQPYLRMFDTDIQMGLARIPHVQASMSKLRRGDEFIPTDRQPRWMSDWFHDPRLTGVVNHCTRSHIRSDLHR
ncbi:MAG TPA: DNA cytosine methyltransferase, partial [Gemmatales bacterium]|nr:DNA cytosine methyltransferase [Gemmatales bacterium]